MEQQHCIPLLLSVTTVEALPPSTRIAVQAFVLRSAFGTPTPSPLSLCVYVSSNAKRLPALSLPSALPYRSPPQDLLHRAVLAASPVQRTFLLLDANLRSALTGFEEPLCGFSKPQNSSSFRKECPQPPSPPQSLSIQMDYGGGGGFGGGGEGRKV